MKSFFKLDHILQFSHNNSHENNNFELKLYLEILIGNPTHRENTNE